jgi:Tol biopolymer transport system component
VRLPGPFWSPDSRFIGFFAGGVLKRVDVSGGPALTIGDVAGLGGTGGGTWSTDGVILLGSPQGVFRISDGGGPAEPVTKSEVPGNAHAFPHFLPDGKHFVYVSTTSATAGTVRLASLDGRINEPLVEGVSRAQYVPPSAPGEAAHLLYVREATLMAHPFDSDTFKLAGNAFPIAEQVDSAFSGLVAFFSSSPGGALAYRTGTSSDGLSLTWFDRGGRPLRMIGPTGNYTDVALSRAADRVAVALTDARSIAPDIWLMDAKQGVPSRLTSSAGAEVAPVWSPDDQRLAFSSSAIGGGQLAGFLRNLSGAAEDDNVLKAGRIRDWSSDGRYLLYDNRGETGRFHLSILPLEGDRKPIEYAFDRFSLAQGQFAPDPRGALGPPKWIAYVSNESGDNEIYVQAFPPTGRGIRISTSGGLQPRWRRDGKELFYIAPGGSVMAAEVTLAPDFRNEPPRELFKAPITSGGPRAFGFHYDVTADGKQFLVITTPQEETGVSTPITVVLNWQAALRR